jgi:hypothetical protein
LIGEITNNPDSWIRSIEQARGIGPIDTVFPGHGKFGGVEICAGVSLAHRPGFGTGAKEVGMPARRRIVVSRTVWNWHRQHDTDEVAALNAI